MNLGFIKRFINGNLSKPFDRLVEEKTTGLGEELERLEMKVNEMKSEQSKGIIRDIQRGVNSVFVPSDTKAGVIRLNTTINPDKSILLILNTLPDGVFVELYWNTIYVLAKSAKTVLVNWQVIEYY